MIGVSNAIALYLHIPFCRRKCNYCSFVSYECRQADIAVYLKALKAELAQCADGESVSSIYFGGGTPSLLTAEQVGDLLTTIRSLFAVDKAPEITIEANPGTVDKAYLTAIRRLGVNRLSLGVQSLNDRELSLLGRIHSASEARQAVQYARSAGFDNLNLDLIYGLPKQSLSGWRQTLEEAIALKPEHFSLYGLTLEEGTPLWRTIEENVEENILQAIDPDLSAEQYELAEDLLAASGYRHYEISNWAKPGYHCRHNLAYWQNRAYLGVGVAAHSCLNGHRLANTGDINKYMMTLAENLPFLPEMDEEIGAELELAETVILGLRLDEGVRVTDIKDRYGIDVLSYYHKQIEEMAEAGLLESSQGCLQLTRRGRLLSNEVFWRLLPDEVSLKSSTVG
ncbi:MAG: radical SAM family heme chaperone HemW [Chloroflexota bacterium]